MLKMLLDATRSDPHLILDLVMWLIAFFRALPVYSDSGSIAFSLEIGNLAIFMEDNFCFRHISIEIACDGKEAIKVNIPTLAPATVELVPVTNPFEGV